MQNIVNCWLLNPVTSCMTLLPFSLSLYYVLLCNNLRKSIVFTLHSVAYIWPKIDCGD